MDMTQLLHLAFFSIHLTTFKSFVDKNEINK